ncbi:MAG: bifunctional diaminohydroxyphosphoribosylaminopyrimidine deaminase/5-amino-6-(5-phosphoribosylamino)uracil reductase RibD [Parvibaculaceae bacterium]
MDADDGRWMAQALRLGRRTLGATGDNPAVGSVIVKDGALVGAGWTAVGGRPHAEVAALAMAGEKARGATAYVTLEPCSHHGRSAPCAEALVAAGVGRVVAAFEDPDPRVSGRGLARLKEAGIRVDTGVGAEEARKDLAGFLSRIERGRPYLTLKLAVSEDGKIAEHAGAATAITGEEVRQRVHLLRAQSDAILVGIGTVLADDPALTVRLPGLKARSPVRVVADSRLRLPPMSRLAQGASKSPVWLLATGGTDGRLSDTNVEIVACDTTADGRVDLADAMRKLSGRGINRVMAEGGAHLVRALIEADLVDEAWLFTAPKVLGPKAVDALAGLPLSRIMASEQFGLVREERIGEDCLAIYRRTDA